MKQALFGTFLVVFGATALVTLLGIAGPLSIREEYLNKLFYLLIVEVIASVVALFKKTDFFGNQPALAAQQELHRFCQRVAGHWWSSGADPDSLGFVDIAHDDTTGTLMVVGRAYDPDGQVVATWETTASCINLKRKKLYYYWEGRWPRRPGERYDGFGEISFYDSTDHSDTGVGVFSDTNLTDVKSTTTKSSDYRRCSEQEVNVMQGGDSKRIGALVRKKLKIERDIA